MGEGEGVGLSAHPSFSPHVFLEVGAEDYLALQVEGRQGHDAGRHCHNVRADGADADGRGVGDNHLVDDRPHDD